MSKEAIAKQISLATLGSNTASPISSVDESSLGEEMLALLGALRAIPADAKHPKHSVSNIIGWGLRHTDSGIPLDIGLQLANEWDQLSGGDAVGVFETCDPDYHQMQPITKASIFDLAREYGWKGELPWQSPHPLTARIEIVPFPLDSLPPLVREAVREVASFTQAPIALIASCALSSLSLVGQAYINVARTTKLTGPVSLFMLTIADSGERKSTCDGNFNSPVRQYERDQSQAREPEVTKYRADIAAWNAKVGGVKERIKQSAKAGKLKPEDDHELFQLEKQMPEPPLIPRLLYSDATPEALAYSLAKGWPSGGLMSSEAGGVFGSHAMGSDSVMRNLALLNQLWDGGSITIDRRTSESFKVENVRLTVGLQVQEATLQEFFNKSGALARGTGFLARFLVAWPTSTQGYRQFAEPPDSTPHLDKFHNRLTEILGNEPAFNDQGGLDPKMLRLTKEAKSLWVDYYNEVEQGLREGGELYDVRDVASKSADNVARMAALFHWFSESGDRIGRDAVQSATAICAWYLHESRRFFGELAIPQEMVNASKVDDWLIRYCRREGASEVGKSDVLQYGPVRKAKLLDDAIGELVQLNRVRSRKEGRRIIIELNPDLLGFANAKAANPAKDGRALG